MKKLLALLLALMMLFSVATVFAGCEDSGSKKSASSDKDDEEEDEEDEGDEDPTEEGEKDPEGEGDSDDDDKGEASGDKESGKEDKDDEDESDHVNIPDQSDDEDDRTEEEEKPSVNVKESDVLGAIQNYIDLVYNGDTSVFYDCFTDEMYESQMDYTDYSAEDIESYINDEDFMEFFYENDYDSYRDYCGDDLSASIENLEYEVLNDSAMDHFVEEAEYNGIDGSKVSAAVYAYADITYSGSENTHEAVLEGAVFCYDGQWYFAYFSYTINGITGEESSYINLPVCSYIWDIYYMAEYVY